MCFASAVLQLLVYCEPFWRLFGEVGLGSPSFVPRRDKQREKDGWAKSVFEDPDLKVPLVDATIRFLREFGVDQPTREKGRDEERIRDDEANGESEAFIPTYVYDAMKANKRFDTMRVCYSINASAFTHLNPP